MTYNIFMVTVEDGYGNVLVDGVNFHERDPGMEYYIDELKADYPNGDIIVCETGLTTTAEVV